MALIDCQDCGQEVSTGARSCPNCGRPTRPESGSQEDPEVIEATGRRAKAQQLVGGLLGIIGAVVYGGGEQTLGGILVGLGVLGYGLGRFGAWWYHG